jgi:outer membrane lipoprotein LolB
MTSPLPVRARIGSAALATVILLALSACQTLAPLPTTAWPERRAALQTVERFQFNGQLAAATSTQGFSAALRWQQQGDASELLLRGPMGAGGAQLRFDATTLQVTAADGTALQGDAAHAELLRLLGFEPPFASLRYWLLGVPDPAQPAEESVDGAQRLSRLRQADWQVDYSEYVAAAGQWLPGRLALQRGTLRLKLRVSHWQLP